MQPFGRVTPPLWPSDCVAWLSRKGVVRSRGSSQPHGIFVTSKDATYNTSNGYARPCSGLICSHEIIIEVTSIFAVMRRERGVGPQRSGSNGTTLRSGSFVDKMTAAPSRMAIGCCLTRYRGIARQRDAPTPDGVFPGHQVATKAHWSGRETAVRLCRAVAPSIHPLLATL